MFNGEQRKMTFVDTTRYHRLGDLVEMLNASCHAGDDMTAHRAILKCLHQCYGVDAYVELDTDGLSHNQYRVTRIAIINGHEMPQIIDGLEPSLFAGGALGQLIQSPEAKLATHVECRNDSVLRNFFPCCQSLLAIPMGREQHSPVKWLVFLSVSGVGFTRSNIEQVAALGVVAHSRLEVHELHRQLDGLHAEMQWRADRLVAIQRALLSGQLVTTIPGISAAVSHEPCGKVGGDFYGVMPVRLTPNGTATSVAILIGDVCGHDVSSTVVMAIVLAILRCYPQMPTSPAAVLRHVNEHLHRMNLPDAYATAFLGFLSLDSLKLTYCRAAHPQPLVRHPDGTVRTLDCTGGYPLGMFEDAQCEDVEDALIPGSLLCLSTDGVADTASPSGTPYGLESLKGAFAAADGDPQSAVDGIIGELGKHQASAYQTDDRTLMVVKLS